MSFEINMIGGGFQHAISTCDIKPKYIKWIKGTHSANVSIHIDGALQYQSDKSKINYGWLVESKTIIPSIYDWCSKNIDHLKANFTMVFTHDLELYKLDDIFQLTQCSVKSFIEDGGIFEKTKLVSMIASNKRYCKDHNYRQLIIEKYKDSCDHYGTGHNPIANKIDGLRDYCFSISMENATYPNMITEKITDCFITGTIPIYYGISDIGNFFNPEGIIILNNSFNINDLSFDLYNSKIDAIKENYEISKNLLCAEDYIYENYIK